MKTESRNGTSGYKRQQSRELTVSQLNAIDLLVLGKTDKETAELCNLSRTCVSKWRLYNPVFQAALNERRAEIWSSGIDRLRALVPKALDVLSQELDKPDSPARLKAASELLRLIPLSNGILKIGTTDPDEIVRQIVTERRSQMPSAMADILCLDQSLPPYAEQIEETWKELEDRSNHSEPD